MSRLACDDCGGAYMEHTERCPRFKPKSKADQPDPNPVEVCQVCFTAHCTLMRAERDKYKIAYETHSRYHVEYAQEYDDLREANQRLESESAALRGALNRSMYELDKLTNGFVTDPFRSKKALEAYHIAAEALKVRK